MQLRIPGRLKLKGRQLKNKWRELRWASVASKRRTFVVRLQPGLNMRLYGDSELCRLIYCCNFEATERAFLNHFLRPGDTFIDVGANIGLFTLIAATRVGRAGSVVAFEPTTTTHARLMDNVELNEFSNVNCMNLALSDHSGYVDLIQSTDGFDAWNSLAEPIAGKTFHKEPVEVIEWDRYAEEHDLIGRTTMMKIDVEGWESRVLAGGKEVFNRTDAPLLQVEFADETAKAAGSSCRDLYQCLENFGYRMFVYNLAKRNLLPEPVREKYPYSNLIATKDPESVNARLRT
jgi:FkbM family methyltransferase